MNPNLTEREEQIIRLIAVGLTNRQIAEELHISERTARTHVYALMGKLHANNRTHAVFLAGFVKFPEDAEPTLQAVHEWMAEGITLIKAL